MNPAYELVTILVVQGSAGENREIDAVIDTGLTGFLTVTPSLARKLGLDFLGMGPATLADGSEVAFPYYGVVVF